MEKILISQKEIEELIKNNKTFLKISKNTIITPAAVDILKDHNIRIEYEAEYTPEVKNCSKEILLKFYYLMMKIRLFESLVKKYREEEIIPGIFVHSYIGQEAVATGVCSALGKNDCITSTHRGHGHLIAKGANISKMLAEMLGKSDGYSKGKGGSMHIADYGLGILGANGIVGAGLPIACGSGIASKLSKDGTVTVAFFGDGATNQGTFGESLNFAKIFSLPVLFLCENNCYGVSTPTSYCLSTKDVLPRAAGYGLIAESCDGDDVFDVYAVCKKHIDMIREESHPVFIEAKVHRQLGHWVGDPQKYRPTEEIQSLADFDPIKIFFNKIKSRSDISDADIGQINSKLSDEIAEAAVFAEKSHYLPVGEAVKDFLKE